MPASRAQAVRPCWSISRGSRTCSSTPCKPQAGAALEAPDRYARLQLAEHVGAQRAQSAVGDFVAGDATLGDHEPRPCRKGLERGQQGIGDPATDGQVVLAG